MFNGVSGAFVTINSEKYPHVREILASPNNPIWDTGEYKDLKDKLVYGGFIIEDDVDEIAVLKVRNRLRRFGNSNFGLTIAPTMNCNFKCIYCYEEEKYKIGTMNDDIIEGVLNFVKEKIKNSENFSVTWFGGEPLLALKQIRKLTKGFKKICKLNNCRYSASMITNGYLLSSEVIRELSDLKVGFIQVTIDGPRNVHDRRRVLKNGGSTFDVIIKNLKNLIRNKKTIRVGLRVNVDKENMETAHEIFDIVKKEGLTTALSISFGKVDRVYNSLNYSGDCFTIREYGKFLLDMMKKQSEAGVKIERHPVPMWHYCTADTFSGFVIDSVGYLYKCWNDVGRIEEHVGMINRTGFKSTPKLVRWLAWDPLENEECLNCEILPNCMGGCPYFRMNASEEEKCSSTLKYCLIEQLHLYYLSQKYFLIKKII